MAIIWLVEMDEQHSESIYSQISGDFAVRRIASIESLRTIYAIEHESRRPQLIVAREPKCDDHLKILACVHTLQRLTKHCVVALTADSSSSWQEITMNLGIPRIAFNLKNGFSLKAQIDVLLSLRPSKLNQQIEADSRAAIIAVGDVEFHPKNNAIAIHGASAENLLPKEARIFEVLAKSPNTCVSRTRLAEVVWPGITISDRTLDSHVSRLRRKLEGSFECGIESVYGEGYRLRVGENDNHGRI
jgi:DNA-binding response OmpR family regulator